MNCIDPSRCPACGQPNHCARVGAQSTTGGECWCHHVQIPPTVLAALPAAAKGKACVCATCAHGDATKPTGCPPRA